MEGKFGDEWWKVNLRMHKSTFTLVCNLLRPYIEKQVGLMIFFLPFINKFIVKKGICFMHYVR